MSRLYYEPQAKEQDKQDATRGAVTLASVVLPGPPEPPEPPDTRTRQVAEKIAKLIPVEIIAGYSTLISFAVLVPKELALMHVHLRPACFVASFVASLILTPVYLSSMADAGKPKIMHLVVSTLAFPFWAYLTSGAAIFEQAYIPSLAGFAVALFTMATAWVPLDR